MWLSKFLDLTDDVKLLAKKFQDKLFVGRKQHKLTPLEFTILEIIFNYKAEISGYDLIKNLNDHFAGTWKARSGTIYPMLSKLQKDGILKSRNVKSPIGPLRKVYSITEAGKSILITKVNKNFLDQLKFIENFLVELSLIYIHSFPEEKQEIELSNLSNLIEGLFDRIKKAIPMRVKMFKLICPFCNENIARADAEYCPKCGSNLSLAEDEERNEFGSVEDINGNNRA